MCKQAKNYHVDGPNLNEIPNYSNNRYNKYHNTFFKRKGAKGIASIPDPSAIAATIPLSKCIEQSASDYF